MKQVVLFGGTFAPFHMGHLHAVRVYRQRYAPDLMIVMPDAVPPHKQTQAEDNPLLRLEMTKIALLGEEGYGSSLVVSDWEIRQNDVSYTYRTLEHLSAPDRELTLLCGTDMFLTLPQWRNPERIFGLARIACVRREEDPSGEMTSRVEACRNLYEERFGARVILLTAPSVELSSSQIRQKLKNGESTEGLLPPSVEAWIRQKGLFGTNHEKQ